MLTSRRMTDLPSAGLARARLLHDVAHTRFDDSRLSLTPNDQTRFALQIAKSFKQHYVTEIVYLQDRQVAAATIKPVSQTDIPHTITVDADGNVDVSYNFARQTRMPWWILFTIGSTLIALIALLTMSMI